MRLHILGLAFGVAAACVSPAAVAQQAVLTIDQAIERALDAAPELRASVELRRAAAGALMQASVRPNPTVQLEAENFAGSDPFNGLGGGEYTYSLGQRIERGGKRAARMSIADAEGDLARIDQARTELDVITEVRSAYVEVMAATAQFAIAQEQEQLGRELVDAVTRRVASARDPEAALLRVKARAAELGADRTLASKAIEIARRRLASYWGGSGDTFTVETAPLFAQPKKTDVLAPGIESSPDAALLAANEARAGAALRLEQANAKQDPTVSLGVRHLAGDDAVAGVVSFSMPLALFDTNTGAIAKARAERNRAKWQKRAGMMRLERELAMVSGRYVAASAEARAIRDNIIPQAEAALSSARQGFQRGAFTYLDVIEAHRALADLKSREISTLTRLRQAEIALDRLNGRKPDNLELSQ